MKGNDHAFLPPRSEKRGDVWEGRSEHKRDVEEWINEDNREARSILGLEVAHPEGIS